MTKLDDLRRIIFRPFFYNDDRGCPVGGRLVGEAGFHRVGTEEAVDWILGSS
jgi:hypothetical protein